MNQDFIFEFDYFKDRIKNFKLIGEIADKHVYPKLKELRIYINNVPSSLEFYVHFSYDSNALREIEQMKEVLFSKGKYRPDFSSELLFMKIGDRSFNSFGILNSFDASLISHGFFYQNKNELFNNSLSENHIQRLRKEGYDLFEKMIGGTSLFLSHSSKQKAELEKIIPYLTATNELIWLDKFRLKPDENEEVLKKEITLGLKEADTVFFYITRDFMESNWCKLELDISIKLYSEKKDYNVILVINTEVKELFFTKYNFFIENMNKGNIFFMNSNQVLEEFIGSFLERIRA
ncbi:toll/interleukin-1 receptor domain-containing protein [Paenibacillus nicotianae]|uniref:Toll/interleukin-1 receptor domain-containing protein n=1 Tax=Paenibacillus nicotianae TaxID=1526551 RepID=A0ABW4UV03_9BACL